MIKILLLLFLNSFLAAQIVQYPLGVNLTNDGAFIDIVKHTNRYSNVEEFDENGWPMDDFDLLIMDGRPVAEWTGQIDDPEEYRIDYSGTYRCSFKGRADISLWGSGASIENKGYESETNTTYFDLVIPGPPGSEHGIVNLTFSNTQRSENGPSNQGIKNLKIYHPGYSLDIEQTFTDEYLDLCKIADFQCYRFYTLQNIWSGEPEYPEKTLWENRKLPDDASQISMQNMNGKANGWCWEYIVELANYLQKPIWVNFHISADDDYIRSAAQFLLDNLNPSIEIYVENSNEVWSPTHMSHGPYNQALADELGITFDQAYAHGTVRLSNLFAEVFGENEINNRIKVILAGQSVYPGRSDNHLNYINDTYGSPKNFIWATSVTTYFGTTNPDGDPDEINEGMIESILDQVDSDGNRIVNIQKANDWDLPGGCTSYEGGPHFPAGGSLDNLDNAILSHRTEEMKNVLLTNYIDGWFEQGGGLAIHFTLSGAYQRFGCWGLTDDPSDPFRNYKMEAILAMLNPTNIQELNKDEYQIIDGNIVGVKGIEKIEIYNYSGQQINAIKYYPWYLGGLKPGIYFVKIITEKEEYFIKYYR